MAYSNPQSRLSPPLMHVFRAAHEARDAKRIIDQRNEAGDRVLAGRRLRARQIITESVLRREVSLDLDALLNTVSLDATVDMQNAPHVRKSILNFGLADIAIRTIDENGVEEIPDEAILTDDDLALDGASADQRSTIGAHAPPWRTW